MSKVIIYDLPFCTLVWIGSLLHALNTFIQYCQSPLLNAKNFQELTRGYLSWNYYDNSDIEWQIFKKFYNNYYKYFIFHCLVSNFHKLLPQYHVSTKQTNK